MGTLDMQKLDGRKLKQARRRNIHSHSSTFLPTPLALFLFITIIIIILGIIIMYIFTSLIPSIDLSLIFELIPRIYDQIFTPFYLFFLLNLLIISIFAMTHLHREAPLAPSPRPRRRSPPSPFDHHEMKSLRANHADNQDRFAEIKLNDDCSADYVKVHEAPSDVMSGAVVDKQLAAYDFEYPPRSADQLRRRGDRDVHQADSENIFTHFDEISAASMMADSGSAASNKLPDPCSYGGAADNDPYMQANHKVITESDVAKKINEDQAVQKTMKAEESKKAADFCTVGHANPGSAADEPLISKQNLLLNSEEEASFTPERARPLASAHFAHKKAANRTHMDMLRSNSPLKISRPSVKRGDTLDATWKAICDSKLRHSSPLHRHHITSHTWKGDNHVNAKKIGVTNKSPLGSSLSPLSPSKQSHHMTTGSSSGIMKRRELSIPRDELNARVESFISKFNQQIRIQREESLLRYRNMVNRGAS